MQNQIETIWRDPEKQSWKNISNNSIFGKLYEYAMSIGTTTAVIELIEPVRRVLGNKSEIILEYIFSCNMTRWQNNV